MNSKFQEIVGVVITGCFAISSIINDVFLCQEKLRRSEIYKVHAQIYYSLEANPKKYGIVE